MGKRGPAPKGEYSGKSVVFSTRIRPDTRAALAEAAKRSGRSLSQEVEYRLRRTFRDETAADDAFGGLRNKRLMQLVGIAMTLIDPDRPSANWLDDPIVFQQVIRAVHSVLWAVRPPGTPSPLTEGSGYPEQVAEAIWAMIHSADENLPVDVSVRQHRANLIKADLADVVDRPTYSLTNYIPPPPTTKARSKKGNSDER